MHQSQPVAVGRQHEMRAAGVDDTRVDLDGSGLHAEHAMRITPWHQWVPKCSRRSPSASVTTISIARGYRRRPAPAAPGRASGLVLADDAERGLPEPHDRIAGVDDLGAHEDGAAGRAHARRDASEWAVDGGRRILDAAVDGGDAFAGTGQ
jgi:hypothetical protein